VTPQWVGQLKARLVATGELIVKQSRGRRPNVYRIPWERCAACQGNDRDQEVRGAVDPDDFNPKLECRDNVNRKVPSAQPQSAEPATLKWTPANPKVGSGSIAHLAWIEPRKEVKEIRERKEGATRKCREEGRDKPEIQSPWWCPAHGYCHSERQPDHRPDCMLEPLYDPSNA
jgi:hypothetical protein